MDDLVYCSSIAALLVVIGVMGGFVIFLLTRLWQGRRKP